MVTEPFVVLRTLLLGALVSPPLPHAVRSLLSSKQILFRPLLALCLRDPSRISSQVLDLGLHGLRRALAPHRLVKLFGFELDDVLEDVSGPVLLIHGADDQIVSRRDLDYFIDRIPHAEGVVMHGGAHWILLEYPGALVEELERFWAKH